MNAPMLARLGDTEPGVSVREWGRVGLALGVGLLALGLLFHAEVAAAVHTWMVSTAYNHCFLVVPIVAYLLWERRADLVGLAPRAMPASLLLGVPLGLAWLAAERLGIMEGRQLAALGLVEALLLAVLGSALWRAMAGPLLYLVFLVPFGAFLTPALQDFTTWFIRVGLGVLGVPAFIDGYVIEIPQGTFLVAEACAGLRFLIASVAFGCLYALVMYRGAGRRAVFILVSVVVPVIANGFRGLGIVYLGYLLNSAEAAAADHVIYGWIFFSFVILVLIMLGLPFRQDELPTRSGVRGAGVGRVSSAGALLAVALGTVAIAAVGPALVAGLATAAPVAVARELDFGPGCSAAAVGAGRARVVCGGVAMDVRWAVLSPRVTAGPLMGALRLLVARAESEDLQEHWLPGADGRPSAWRVLSSGEPAYVTAVAVWVDGKVVRPGLAMRERMAVDSLFGARVAPVVVAVTPAADWAGMGEAGVKAQEAGLAAFLRGGVDWDKAASVLAGR